MGQRHREGFAERVEVAERAVQDIARAQRIDGSRCGDRDFAAFPRHGPDDGMRPVGDGHPLGTDRVQVVEDGGGESGATPGGVKAAEQMAISVSGSSSPCTDASGRMSSTTGIPRARAAAAICRAGSA